MLQLDNKAPSIKTCTIDSLMPVQGKKATLHMLRGDGKYPNMTNIKMLRNSGSRVYSFLPATRRSYTKL